MQSSYNMDESGSKASEMQTVSQPLSESSRNE